MKFHDELNPKLWDKDGETYKLNQEVEEKLKEIADAFIEYLDIPQDSILDMVITGSSASYNYTPYSDLDLHIIVDFDKVHKDCPIVEGYLGAMKSVFNKEHDIFIHGIPVELYAEKKDQGTVHNGLYSLKTGWIDVPKKIPPTNNDAAVDAKYQEIKDMIDKCDTVEVAIDLLDKIYAMRKAGLAEAGEFSTENLAFKKLRNDGAMDKLRQLKKENIDKQLTLEAYKDTNKSVYTQILNVLSKGSETYDNILKFHRSGFSDKQIGNALRQLMKDGKVVTKYYDNDLHYSLASNTALDYDSQEILNNQTISESINTTKLKTEIEDKIKEFFKNDEDALEWAVIEVVQDSTDIKVEVRVELDYNGMWNLSELLNPIVSKYDKYAYFDFEEPGIMVATIEVENESINEKIELPMSTSNEPYIEVTLAYGRPLTGYRLIDGTLYYTGRNGTKQIGKNVTLDNLAKRILSHAKNVTKMDIDKIEVDDKVIWDCVNESIKEDYEWKGPIARVTFDNGDVIETAINGTDEEIKSYYMNNVFNLGREEDDMHKVVKVEVIRESVEDVHSNFKSMVKRIVRDFKVKGYPKSNKFYMDFAKEAVEGFKEDWGHDVKILTGNGELILTLEDTYQATINTETHKIKFSDLENSNYMFESIYKPSTILSALKLERAWYKELGLEEDELAPQVMFFVIENDEIKDTKLVDRKDVYTYKPEENEFYLDRLRDSGDDLVDYNLAPVQKMVKLWNNSNLNENSNELKFVQDLAKVPSENIYFSLYQIGNEYAVMDNLDAERYPETYVDIKFADNWIDAMKAFYETDYIRNVDSYEDFINNPPLVFISSTFKKLAKAHFNSMDEDVATLCDKIDATEKEAKELINMLTVSESEELKKSLKQLTEELINLLDK